MSRSANLLYKITATIVRVASNMKMKIGCFFLSLLSRISKAITTFERKQIQSHTRYSSIQIPLTKRNWR